MPRTLKVHRWVAQVVLSTALLHSQVDMGRVTGIVTDSTGAVVTGAHVSFRHVETNTQNETETNAQGRYLSIPLRVGAYEVSVQASGFKREVRSGIVLQIQETARLDFRLQVGEMVESITVKADAPLLQTNDVSQGQVIDNRKIVDLPLNGRDYLQLAALSSGAIPRTGQKGSTGFSANGLRTELNNYMLDGLDNNMHQMAYTGGQAQAVEPSVDAIQEFKVQTSDYSAEFGNNMGAVVNISLKSGTNRLHGGVYEFLRNEKFDAKNFFDRPGDPKAPYKQNQFGFTLGGPVRRDKTFFFLDYDGTRRHVAGTVLSNVPTARERQGDFSQSTLRGLPVRIFDPASYMAATRTRTEFPNAVIPPSRIDPVGRNAASLYPLPNVPSDVNNFLNHPVNPLSENKFDVRLDHTFSARDTVFGRASYQLQDEISGQQLPPPAFGTGSNDLSSTGRSYALNHTHVFSPALFLTTKLGYNQFLTNRRAPTAENLNNRIGLRGLPYDIPGLATFTMSNFRSIGTMSGNPNRTDSQVRQLKSDLNWVRGHHTLKTGLSLSWLQSPQIHYYQANGVFSFNGNFTRQSSNNQFGDDLADLLLGLPFDAQLSARAQSALRRGLYHGYTQDEFQITPALSLSLGLRYEFNGPWVDKYDHLSNFDIYTGQLILAKPGSIADRATVLPHYRNFAPRGGLAWRLGQKIVIRAGYGIYYGGVDHIGDRYLHASPPFFFQSTFTSDSITPNIVLRNGYPLGATTANVTNLQTISQERDNPTPYSQQWNFTIQRALRGDMSVEIGYVGTSGVHLLIRRDSNAPPPGPGDINARRPARSLAVPGLNYVVAPLSDTFRREWSTHSSYNGLQLKLEKRYSSGLSLLAAYMWAKAIDNTNSNPPPNPYNLSLERALSDNDVPHRFVASYNFDLPVGRGRRFGAAWRGLPNAVLGGWALGGIGVISSGDRVDTTVQGNPQNNGQANRPNLLRNPILPAGQRSLDRWFDTSAFARNDPFTFGNAPRNAIEGPGRANLDLAIYKQFDFAERCNAQFRTEMFNATNTPHFGNPNPQFGSRNFGVISSAGAPRIIQFGLKLRF